MTSVRKFCALTSTIQLLMGKGYQTACGR